MFGLPTASEGRSMHSEWTQEGTRRLAFVGYV